MISCKEEILQTDREFSYYSLSYVLDAENSGQGDRWLLPSVLFFVLGINDNCNRPII